MSYPLPTPLDDPYCGNCRIRPRRWGDWLCPKCREEVGALWREASATYRFRRALKIAEGEEKQ